MRAILLFAPFLATAALADPQDDAAVALYRASLGETCFAGQDEAGNFINPPPRHDLMVPTSYGEPPQPTVLWQFPCLQGAYNTTDVFVIWDDYDGFRLAPLAEPDIQVEVVDPDAMDPVVKSLTLTGWSASPFASNPDFDPQALTLTTHASWRGLDDASDGQSYVLIDGHFRLIRAEVDASYDGMVNPELMFEAP